MTTKSLGRGWAAALLAGLLALGGCARNPVTGERQLVLISESQEIEMGRQAAAEAAQSLGLVRDDALQAYVQRMGAELAAESERPELPWTFRVVDDPTPNAFALPGGFIFVTRGMLSLMDSESELATVLGHEIGHVTARHSVTQISRAQLAQLGLGLGTIFFPQLEPLGGLASSGLGLLFLKYGRDAERQADELGFKYALNEGYDVREMADVFASLQRVGEGEGRSPIPSWLATHPAPAERIEDVEERLASLQASLDSVRLGRAEYLGQIDNLVYGENPRNGFFREGAFYHPELRFRFGVPSGWRTQNTAQAVMLGSPQQDALIQLTLAGQVGAAQAAQRLLGQQGVQTVRSSRQSINGIPAVVSYFQAQTQQGVLRGAVAHLEYGGNTYQLLAYAPAERFPAYDRLFGEVIGSFGPLTDPQLLGVQPNRIDIVRLDRSLSLAEFNRAYPSVIPLEELAVLNQVTDVNATLEAGTLLKRVVAS
jgi:predicted Zn-dependent protease